MIDFPCAKINLGLNIVARRHDGYHDLETVFYPVNINDKISIEQLHTDRSGSTCTLNIEGLTVDGPTTDNLIVRAYNMVKESYPDLPGVNITLYKNIPMQAGMGGGSADCAFTIRMLNDMFSLGMSRETMKQMAARLGADCAFFIDPQPAFATGIGDKLIPASVNLSDYALAVVKPPLKISTKEAFANVTPKRPGKCCLDIVKQPICTWKDELVNDFEQSIIPQHPEIADIKQRLYGMGAVYAAMSGSGSALFGIFESRPANLEAAFNGCFTTIV